MKRVCIVDDDKVGLGLLEISLKDKCLLTTYSSSLKFLKDYIAGDIEADILILDLIMPDFTGIEVVNKLKELDLIQDLKIYICTSMCDCSYIIKELGVDGYFLKSRTTAEELLNIIMEN